MAIDWTRELSFQKRVEYMKIFKDNFKNHLLFYGSGAVAFGVKANGFNYLLLYFYSQIMGLPPEKVSFGLAIALVIDAFTDPLIGTISDNFRSKLGRRHLFIYIFGPCQPLFLIIFYGVHHRSTKTICLSISSV